jgi:hypothetical protein
VLFFLSSVVNILAMASALWLGFYIVTRSPHRPAPWLTALTLWVVASFFLHNAVAINVPDSGMLPWLRPVVVLVPALWLHLTFTLAPAENGWWALKSSMTARRLIVVLAYILAVAMIALGVIPRGLVSGAEIGTAAYLSGRESSPLYPLLVPFCMFVAAPAFLNLWLGRQHATEKPLQRQYGLLFVASALAGFTLLYYGIGVWKELPTPTLPGDASLAVGVLLLGYSVARYQAFLEARPIERDFRYSLLAIVILAVFYYAVSLALYFGGQVSFLSLMLVIAIAVSSHALYDGVRAAVDRIFYRDEFRRLRANLNALARDAGVGQSLSGQLQAVVRSLCRAYGISRGFIALRIAEGFEVEAVCRIKFEDPILSLTSLSTPEIVELPWSALPTPEEMALLVPLFAAGEQVGALVLGPKESKQAYTESDLDLLDDLADQIAHVIYTAQIQEQNTHDINGLVSEFRNREKQLQRQLQALVDKQAPQPDSLLPELSDQEFRSCVEEALRRLYDFSFLGADPLAQLQVVSLYLDGDDDAFVTHIDHGKALNGALLDALHKLRPDGQEPPRHEVPSREWYPFIILHDAYVLGEPNRNIMGRLYISEGTFNRTRRRAIRSVATALKEMEQAARRREVQAAASS